MSLSIDQSKYFISSYVSQLSAQAAVNPDGGNAPGEGTDSTEEIASVAPPPSNTTQLIADSDMRLLLLRGVDSPGLEGYSAILNEFYSTPSNQTDPVGFLRNLSSDGIDLLKKAQSLPSDAQINVASLSDEEAMNLILPFSRQVDLNNDGIVASGNGGKMFRFPPPNAPQSVKDAWESASANMSDKDRFLLSSKFMIQFFTANLHVDANGRVSQTEPGEPGWRNVFSEDGYSYRKSIDEFLAENEFAKKDRTPELYERTKKLLNLLDDAFQRQGVV